VSDYNQDNIGTGYNSASSINSELTKVETAVNSKVDKSGSTLTGDLDMNSNNIINLPDATTSQEPATYSQLLGLFTSSNFTSADAKFIDTLALATADTSLSAGDVVIVKDRANGVFDVISGTGTANTFDIVSHDTLSLSLSLRVGDYANLLEFGVKAGDTIDQTLVIQRVADYSKANKNKTIFANTGQYRLDGVVTFQHGTAIVCEGSQGSTEQFGTTFKHHSNGDMFIWDGGDIGSFGGTGGGIRNCLLLKATTFSGGRALHSKATNTVDRAGEMVFENILINGTGTGLWGSGAFSFDGSLATTVGGKGVRDVNVRKLRVSGCNTIGESIILNQVTHFYGWHIQVDQGAGSQPGLKVQGDSENVFFDSCELGDIVIDGNPLAVTINGGKVKSLTQNTTTCTGSINCIIDSSLTNKSKSFRVLGSSSPRMFFRLATTQNNKTGNNASYTVAFDDTVYDDFSWFSGGTVRVQSAGLYRVRGYITYGGLGATVHTSASSHIHQIDTSSAFVANYLQSFDPDAQRGAGTQLGVYMDATVDCSFNDGISMVAKIAGGLQDVEIQAISGGEYKTWMSIEAI